MSSVINGKSTANIKFFREEPAALSVYWIYCARQNNEGRAWPSLRGLQYDTGWSLNSCSKARQWLVDHRVLERDPDYIRPAWRKLSPQALTQKRNLDHTEYYRVTGIIEINHQEWPLLYENEQQGDFADNAQTDTAYADVSPGQTTKASNTGPEGTELTTIENPQLGSIVAGAITPAVAAAKTPQKRERNPVFDKVAEYAFGIRVGEPVGSGTAARVGKILAELKASHGGQYPAVSDITQACLAWKYAHRGLDLPRDPAKFDAMIREWEQQRSTPPAPSSEYGVPPGTTQAELDAICDRMFRPQS